MAWLTARAGDDEGHHEDERVEREADQVNEAEPHTGAMRPVSVGPERAAPVVEVHPAEDPLHAVREVRIQKTSFA
jgi:hypothetical protein